MQAVCMNLIPSLYMTYYRHGIFWPVSMIFMEPLVMTLMDLIKLCLLMFLWCRLLEKLNEALQTHNIAFSQLEVTNFL